MKTPSYMLRLMVSQLFNILPQLTAFVLESAFVSPVPHIIRGCNINAFEASSQEIKRMSSFIDLHLNDWAPLRGVTNKDLRYSPMPMLRLDPAAHHNNLDYWVKSR